MDCPGVRLLARRRQLLDAPFTAGGGLSAAAVMFHSTLAAHQGVSATEEKALSEKYTDGELELITGFLTESARRQKNATSRLTSPGAGTPEGTGDAGPAADDDDHSTHVA